jgi:MoxR-like ATPase
MIKQLADNIKFQLNSRVLNQELLTELALTSLFAGGHVLIEGVPGLAKTLWARSLAELLSVECRRVQFTSDLMPSDILGTKVFNQLTGQFELRKGPLFTQLFLADEINRTPPKTQSALLEVMEERAITIDGQTHRMAEPFFVMATQNPIEYEGTYPLPEALTDRFMMKILIGYPGVAAEKQMLQMHHAGQKMYVPPAPPMPPAPPVLEPPAPVPPIMQPVPAYGIVPAPDAETPSPYDMNFAAAPPTEQPFVQPIEQPIAPPVAPVPAPFFCTAEQIAEAKREVQAVTVDDAVFNYIVSVIETTRRVGAVQFGASPRGSVALLLASKAFAAIQGRDFVIPDDVRTLTLPVLRHRILIKPEAEIEGITPDAVIENILQQVNAPR